MRVNKQNGSRNLIDVGRKCDNRRSPNENYDNILFVSLEMTFIKI